MRERPVAQKLEAVHIELHVVFGDRNRDGTILGAVECARAYALQVIERFRDASLERVERLLVILEPRRFLPGQVRHRVARLSAGELHLLRQRVHVGRKPRLDQGGGIGLAQRVRVWRPCENVGQRTQHRHKRFCRHCINRDLHGDSFLVTR